MMVILEHAIKIDVNKHCRSAFSGKKAIQIIQDNIDHNHSKGHKSCDFKLILMDCNMPEMDGYETSIKIRDIFLKCGLP